MVFFIPLHIFLYFLFRISLKYGFKPYYKKFKKKNSIIKYKTTQNIIKMSEKLLKSIEYGYLRVNFIFKL